MNLATRQRATVYKEGSQQLKEASRWDYSLLALWAAPGNFWKNNVKISLRKPVIGDFDWRISSAPRLMLVKLVGLEEKFFLFLLSEDFPLFCKEPRGVSSLPEEIWHVGNSVTKAPWMLAGGKPRVPQSPQAGIGKQTTGRIFLSWSSNDAARWSWTVLLDSQ